MRNLGKHQTISVLLLGFSSSALAQAPQVPGQLIQNNYGDCVTYLPFESVKAAVQKPPKAGILDSGEILPDTKVDATWPKHGKIKINGADVDYDLSRIHMRFRPSGVAANEVAKILDYTTLCKQYMTPGGSYQEHCALEAGKPKTGLVNYETVTTLWNRSWDEQSDPNHVYKGKYRPCRDGTQVLIDYAITPDIAYADSVAGFGVSLFSDTAKAKKFGDYAAQIFKTWVDGFKAH